jgi:hypothetical protein
MDLKATAKHLELHIRKNSPEILAGLGVSGVVTTAYLAHRAGYGHGYSDGKDDGNLDPWRFRLKHNWKRYIPPVLTGTLTIACVIGGTKISRSRTAAITAAYSLTEKAFSEYKEKVQEKIGERKEQTLKDELAQDRVRQITTSPEVILVGKGSVMCIELRSQRPFLGDMELIKRAEIEINDRLIRCDYASLAEFHTQIGISPTPDAGDFGWTHERGLLKLDISTVLSDRDIPCIAFDYNYLQAL